MDRILDSCFVISAERDARRGVVGRTSAYFARRANDTFFITFTVAGELACGQSATARADWERLCLPYLILPSTPEITWRYGEIYRALAAKGQLIGTNDLWIAATAVAHGFGVVTDNEAEFRRVPGLVVEGF
jgi:predicted nucleic acid-binding protein